MCPAFAPLLLSAIESVHEAWVLVTVTSELAVLGEEWLKAIAAGLATASDSSVPTVPETSEVDVAASELAGRASAPTVATVATTRDPLMVFTLSSLTLRA